MTKSIIISVATLIAIFVVVVALTEVPKKHTFLENNEVTQQTSGTTTED